MKFLKHLLPVVVAACGFASAHADEFATTQEMRERDIEALSDFIKTKRAISVQEKGGQLMISGDVRFEWSHLRSKMGSKKQRGSESVKSSSGVPYATNEFDVEANLMFDYKADRTWASLQLKYDNIAGIEGPDSYDKDAKYSKNQLFGSGTGDDLFLRKAYMGYNVMEQGTSRFDVELGRRRLYDVFDSRVQFRNLFDGILLTYMSSHENLFDFQARGAWFVIDQNVNHWGWVGEVRFLNIADMGLDATYSFIHWDKHGVNRFGKRHPYGACFNVSQVGLTYNLPDEVLHKKSKFYAAYLHNHTAERAAKATRHLEGANGFYIGYTIGEIRKKGDWSADLNYQYVGANTIPESDVSGVGKDNPRNISMYNNRKYGYANYKAVKLEGFYAMTDNLTLNMQAYRCRQAKKKIGHHKSSKFELAAIYAF